MNQTIFVTLEKKKDRTTTKELQAEYSAIENHKNTTWIWNETTRIHIKPAIHFNPYLQRILTEEHFTFAIHSDIYFHSQCG